MRGSAGGASHLPTRVVPSSSIDRARQYRARSGLRTRRSWVLDSTDINGHLALIYKGLTAKGLKAEVVAEFQAWFMMSSVSRQGCQAPPQ
jgi:hypothetical protein